MKYDHKGTLEEYMEYIKIPKEYQFLGFCIHHEQRDEFLLTYEIDEYICKKTWSVTPELSMKYSDQLEAEKVANEIDDGSVVALLFDSGDSIFVSVPR